MIRLSVIPLLLAILLMSVLPAAAQDTERVVTLERGACFGACPIYRVSLYEDGRVVYEGERFVDVLGEQSSEIDPAAVQDLIATFDKAGYFGWDDEYTDLEVTDAPYITTSVTKDGMTKQIVRYTGNSSAPLLLPYLETWIDDVANARQWTGADIRFPYIGFGTTPVITLEREACFGFCPVYRLALYEDGTVVYMGLQNVEVSGVHSKQIEADQVRFLSEMAQAMGYFGWQDEYLTQIVTDHATVATSLNTADQSKRILRYDGDPNAPVGLLRIEDNIDRVVDITQWP
jgi:hypothetical protein